MAASVEEHDLLLALFHVPKKLNDMAAAGIHLAFGGHTHGGQIRIPGIGALITDSELKRNEASGLIRRGRTLFHVSRGLGADPRSNFRLFCPPAATILEVIY
jgi:predicted MPP superfamily phosphohydrolase